jgi:hypothetical protein
MREENMSNEIPGRITALSLHTGTFPQSIRALQHSNEHNRFENESPSAIANTFLNDIDPRLTKQSGFTI